MKKKYLIARNQYLEGELYEMEQKLLQSRKDLEGMKNYGLKKNDVVQVCDYLLDGWNGVLCIVDEIKNNCIRVKMREPHRDGIYYANFMPDQLRKVGEL